MKLKKGVMITMIVVLLIGGAVNAVYAVEPPNRTLTTNMGNQMIGPLWDNISIIAPNISTEGTTLYPEVYIKSKSLSGSISGRMYLERYSLGSWIGVTLWDFARTGSVFISRNYKGVSGVRYRTRVTVTVDGETAVATSGSCVI